MAIYRRTPVELLLEKVNEQSPGSPPLTLTNCVIGTPRAISDPKFNTEVEITGIQYLGYVSKRLFKYNRLDFSLLFLNVKLVIDTPVAGTTHQAISNLNTRYGINLTADDIENYNIRDGYDFTLRAKAGSLQYTGQVIGRYINAGYRLGDVLRDRNLDTLHHPILDVEVALGRKSAAMLAYGIDFTLDANHIEDMVNGPMGSGINYTSGNSDALVQTMAGYGLPMWDYSKATINRYGQNIVTNAQPNYGAVAVITGIVDPAIAGTFYLHYNKP